MLPETESAVLEDLSWFMPEVGAGRHRPFQRYVFANLEGLHGNIAVDFEIKARFLDNRRSELPVWARTNSVKRP